MAHFTGLKEGQTITSDQGAKNSYQLTRRVGRGSFGELWCASMGKTAVGIKFERREGEKGKPQLGLEFMFYLRLGQHKTVPIIYDFFNVPVTPYHCLVMELLGKSLEGMLDVCGRQMSEKNVIQIGIQLIDCMEYFHSRGLIHRDIKPDNFLFGRKGTKTYHVIRTIDLGLSKAYIEQDGKHIEFHAHAHIMGTPKYMPIHAHQQLQQSRRDDLEAIGYILIYLNHGTLPWDGLRNADPKKTNELILRKKQATVIADLIQDVPWVLGPFLQSVKALKFKEEPNYDKLRELLQSYAKQSKIKLDGKYEFDPSGNTSVSITLKPERGSNVKINNRSSASNDG